MPKKILSFLIMLFLLISPVLALAGNNITVQNPGFEEVASGGFANWTKSTWVNDGNATSISADKSIYRSGKSSALIVNNVPNDARLAQEIKVREDYFYKISCWVRTEAIPLNSKGANISIEGKLDSSRDIKGTTDDWQYLELYGKAAKKQKSFALTVGIGGYGSANIGKAWFDDVTVEEMKQLPAGITAVNLGKETTSNNTVTPKQDTENSADKNIGFIPVTIFIVSVFILMIFAFLYFSKKWNGMNRDKEKAFLYAIFALGIMVRFILAPSLEGHPVDIGCFKGWASMAANNLFSFYNGNVFTDYPPLYVYVLFFIGKFASVTGLMQIQPAYTFLIKLPSIAADLLTGYVIYKMSKNNLKPAMRLSIAALYILNPLVILNSTLWGQVDSFFTMIIIFALYFLYKGNLNYSSVLFAVSVLMKPQGIIFLPVLLCELLKRKNIKAIVSSFIYGVSTAIIIILPFSFAQKSPLWIIELYMKTLGEYPYATLNAYNLFALLGANWERDKSVLFIFDYHTWGMISIVLITLFTFILYYLSKHKTIAYVSALVLITGVFTLASSMHERYGFPGLAIMFILYALLNDKRLLFLIAAYTITGFINTFQVFTEALKQSFFIPTNDLTLISVSLVNVLLLVYLVKVCIDMVIREKIYPLNYDSADNQVPNTDTKK